jgi:hypothetical protein
MLDIESSPLEAIVPVKRNLSTKLSRADPNRLGGIHSLRHLTDLMGFNGLTWNFSATLPADISLPLSLILLEYHSGWSERDDLRAMKIPEVQVEAR